MNNMQPYKHQYLIHGIIFLHQSKQCPIYKVENLCEASMYGGFQGTNREILGYLAQ